MLVSGSCGLYLIFHVLFLGKFLPGWASVMVSVWLLGGMMIFCIGIVGIYLAKVFSETKQRPYTTVRHVYERDEPQTVPAK
jgi:putative glycosyltransferase